MSKGRYDETFAGEDDILYNTNSIEIEFSTITRGPGWRGGGGGIKIVYQYFHYLATDIYVSVISSNHVLNVVTRRTTYY